MENNTFNRRLNISPKRGRELIDLLNCKHDLSINDIMAELNPERDLFYTAGTIVNLQQQIEDMKCCGNCSESNIACDGVDGRREPNKVCHKWQSDKLTAKERME